MSDDYQLRYASWPDFMRRRYRLRRFLEQLSEADADETPVEWFENRMAEGTAKPAIITNGDGTAKGLVLFELLDFSHHRDLNVLGIAVEDRGWKGWLWPQIVEYAKKHGCSGIRGTTARPEACERSMYNRVGMEKHTVTYRVSLDEEEK